MNEASKSTKQQAIEYVARVGSVEAVHSNHYGIAARHCRCGTCFCCEVKNEVDRVRAAEMAAPVWPEKQ